MRTCVIFGHLQMIQRHLQRLLSLRTGVACALCDHVDTSVSRTIVVPFARRPANRIADFTCALATGIV